jgi:nucleoside-triphosphatase THEP1
MIILLTGQRGSGKSTVALNLSKQLSRSGIQVGGIICPGIFDQGRKIGIKSHYLNNGHEEIVGMERLLEGKRLPESTGPDTFSYGRWEFRRSALASADAAIIQDTEGSWFVFVDEIGPLELDHGLGMCRTLARLDADKDKNEGIMMVCARQDLVKVLTERWPGSLVVELTGADPAALRKAEKAILEKVRALTSLSSTSGYAQA